MIHRSYCGSLTVRVDHLKTEELDRVEKTIKLLDDFSGLFYVAQLYAFKGILVSAILLLITALVWYAFTSNSEAHNLPWVVPLIINFFTCAIGGRIGYWYGKKEKAREMPKLLQEAVNLGQQSPLCCNMLRLAFAEDNRLRKIQTPTLTNLFSLQQQELDS